MVNFKFGDSEQLSDQLLALIIAGKKRATCEALRTFESGAETMPEVGRRDTALNWDDTPAVILETTDVIVTRFCDVTEAMALEEGENDDLAGWRRDHQGYYERTGGFDPQMEVVFERFKLIEVCS